MQTSQVDGLAEAYSLFGNVPQAARDQLGVEMARIGYEILAAQRHDVAKDKGTLEAGLSLQLMLDQLRVRIGLIGKKSLFYGRIIEYGRRAQVVLRHRLGLKGRAEWLARIAAGKARRSKRPEDLGTMTPMRVGALAPRPYVHVDRPEIMAAQRLANFWSEVLANVGAAQ